MTAIRLLRLALIVLALGAIATAVLVTIRPVGAVTLPPSLAEPARHEVEAVSAAVSDSLVALAVVRAPFRAARRPAAVAYDPFHEPAAGEPPPPQAPKPVLVLSGIVWGREPAAIVEGLTGASGPRVVRTGDVVGELRVRRIEREWVVIEGQDTTWTLRVRTTWQ